MSEPSSPSSSGFDFNQPAIVALLYLASLLVGVTAIIGVVLAYVWKRDCGETWEASHYQYHIRTSWIGLLASVLCAPLVIVLVGIVGLVAVGVWAMIRTVIALVAAQRRDPIPDPRTLFW